MYLICVVCLQEFEMLDTYWYVLEQSEFDAKWEALGWPYRLNTKMEETVSSLENEFQIFQKLQVDDEFMLQDRIELITSTITNLASLQDFSKVAFQFYLLEFSIGLIFN